MNLLLGVAALSLAAQGQNAAGHVPSAGAAPAPVEIVLKAVGFAGAEVVPPYDLLPAWQGYIGKSVTLADLRTIARNVEAIYAERGYPFVVVTVPAQTVSDGSFRLVVTEGQISDLTVLGPDAAARRQATRIFQPLVGMRPLSAVAVERAYAAARATPGLAVSGALRRGAKLGGMDLVIKAEREPWRISAGVNNWAARTVGPVVASAQADYFGDSAYGDQASVLVSATPDLKAQYAAQGRYERRLNAYGTSASATVTAAKANPGDAVAALNLATNLLAARLEVGQDVIDDGLVAIRFKAALDTNDQETKVFGTERLSLEHLRTATFGGDVMVRGQSVKASLSVEMRKGLDVLGASKPGERNLSRASADPQAWLVRWRFDAETRLLGQVLFARFEGQDTAHSLTTPEQYVFGAQTIGRGYQPGAAFADSAAALSLELRHPGVKVARGVKAEPFVFVDAARLSNPREDTERLFRRRDLASYGAGVRFDTPGPARFELLYAIPAAAPLGLGEKKPAPNILVSVSVGLTSVMDGLLHGATTKGKR